MSLEMSWTIKGKEWTFKHRDGRIGRYIRRGNYFDHVNGHRFRAQEIWSALGWMGMM